jgi:8-oxo-dGTP pyrophosphatase MutT (NUDIX family)
MTEAPGASAPAVSAAELLARFPVLRPPVSTAGAAVTIVLRDGARDVEALLIERAQNPVDPASGDVALPGGHVDESDGSLAHTALRELREEVGLGLADLAGPLRFVGSTPARAFRIHVGVFAAGISSSAAPPTIGNPSEVAHVFWLPKGALADGRLVTRESSRGSLRVLATVHDGHLIWGFTRRVLREFFGYAMEDQPQGPAFSAGTTEPGGAVSGSEPSRS